MLASSVWEAGHLVRCSYSKPKFSAKQSIARESKTFEWKMYVVNGSAIELGEIKVMPSKKFPKAYDLRPDPIDLCPIIFETVSTHFGLTVSWNWFLSYSLLHLNFHNN